LKTRGDDLGWWERVLLERQSKLAEKYDATNSKNGHMKLFLGHEKGINGIDFSPNNKLVATASDDTSVIVWDVDKGLQLCKLKGHTGSVRSVAFSADCKFLASGSSDTTIIVYDVAAGFSQIHKLEDHTGFVSSVAFSNGHSCKNFLASGSQDSSLIIQEDL